MCNFIICQKGEPRPGQGYDVGAVVMLGKVKTRPFRVIMTNTIISIDSGMLRGGIEITPPGLFVALHAGPDLTKPTGANQPGGAHKFF